MVLATLMKMVARRLLLRKGLAVSAAVLLLLGWCLLYATTRSTGRGVNGPQPAPSSDMRAAPVFVLPVHKPLPMNLSHLPPHLRSPPPIPHNPLHHQWVIDNSSAQCQFTEVIKVTHVDVQMLDVFEEIPFDNPNGGVWKQGYDITYSMNDYQTEPLTVFVVPHSHNDPGWIKTFNEYFKTQTRLILDNMVEALTADSRRTFIWAEISFLDLWWNQCGQERRQKFRRLVERGQLEIVTGGWVMNDEANTHYFAMTDQMIEGHAWLAKNLPGVIPEIGWAIDPFGHTPSMAYLLQRMGLSGMLVQRVHYSVKKRLAQTRELEFMWRQAWDQHGNTDMLTHMMPFYSYDIPHTCGPDPAVCCQFDFKRLPGSKVKCPWKKPAQVINEGNVRERAMLLADQYRKKAQLYRTNTLLVPLGDDFRWDREKEIEDQFVNYQSLMDYMNNEENEMKIRIQFGTLSDYFSAVQGSTWVTSHAARGDRAFPVLSGDFFTYSDRDDHYWSGYFTSRPFYKHMDRQLESRLRLAEVLFSLCDARHLQTYPTLPELLTSARKNLGLFQHHDGITGTAKDKVVVDYGQRMKEALDYTNTIIQYSSQALLLGIGIVADSLHFSLGESQTVHDSLPKQAVVRVALDGAQTLLIVNPLTYISYRMIDISVDTHLITVTDPDNTTVSCQINPMFNRDGSVSGEHYHLVFPVTLPALGLVQYHLWPSSHGCTIASLNTIHYSTSQQRMIFTPHPDLETQDIKLSTDHITATFSKSTGLLKSVVSGDSEVGVNMDVVTYGTRNGKDHSGAYLFMPDREAQTLLPPGSKPQITVTTGPLMKEVVSEVGLVKVQQRLNKISGEEGQSVSVTTFTDIHTETNKEVALRLRSTVMNNGVFFTDLNGLQLVQRKTMAKLPLQGNFYPMPTMALMQDTTHRLSLLAAQPQGVASLKPGWLEVMLDRRLAKDDERGLGQGVKDNKLTAANFRLLVETHAQPKEASPHLAYPSLLSIITMDTLLHSPHVSFTSSLSKILPYLPSSHSLLSHSLPCDIFLLNLRSSLSRTDSALLLHRRGYDCNYPTTSLSCSASNGTVELKALFKDVDIAVATEMYLSLLRQKGPVRTAGLSVHIPPMELQTYSLKWANTK